MKTIALELDDEEEFLFGLLIGFGIMNFNMRDEKVKLFAKKIFSQFGASEEIIKIITGK